VSCVCLALVMFNSLCGHACAINTNRPQLRRVVGEKVNFTKKKRKTDTTRGGRTRETVPAMPAGSARVQATWDKQVRASTMWYWEGVCS
jgi:hypothetical protein